MDAAAEAAIGAVHAIARSKDMTLSTEEGVGEGGEAAEPAEEPKGEGGDSSEAGQTTSECPLGEGEKRGGEVRIQGGLG